MKAKYRIERITIEGFRGFTDPQTVECAACNVFVFGPNGRGKSSIIEAIRWCLFGSARDREIEVRNTFYEMGHCVVSLVLTGTGEQLTVTRELRPGVNSSRQTIRNIAGETRLLQEALPLLARIGHEHSTQVIFAAQQATGRQAQVDITDFTRALCFYLRLESVPDFLERIDRVLEERKEEAKTMAREVEELEGQYRQRIVKVQAKLDVLLNNPPWGEGAAPSGEESQAKVAALLQEQARLYEVAAPNLTGMGALHQVRQWMDEATTKTTAALQLRLQTLTQQLKRSRECSTSLRSADCRCAAVRSEIESSETRLSELLKGRTLEKLVDELARLERVLTEKETRAEIARLAEVFYSGESTACPLCERPVDAQTLRVAAEKNRSPDVPSEVQRIEELRKEKAEIDRLISSLSGQNELLRQAALAESNARKELCDTLGIQSPFPNVDELSVKVESLARDVDGLRREVEDANAERCRKVKAVKDLESELTYHELRDELERIQQALASGLDPVRNILSEYQELILTAEGIRKLVDSAFTAALDQATPRLNSMMTDVYARLTRQVSYDQIRIWRSPVLSGRRELRVASSRLPDQQFPPNVLNGQAAKALQLVPYFVFSRFQPEVMELDLLLIDDPSESFDTSHVESLIVELAEAAHHAQLFMATHEREKFEPQLDRSFAAEPFKVVSVVDFDPVKGPTLACR